MLVTKEQVNYRLEKIRSALEKRKNVSGMHKVLHNIDHVTDSEGKLDYVVQLEIGHFLSKVGKVEFEGKLNSSDPHDVVLDFRGTSIVVEVRRIRQTSRHNELINRMEKVDGLIEIVDKGEFSRLIRKIVDEKYPQLEKDYPNIIFLVSRDIYYSDYNVQDAAHEIRRFQNKSYYPNYDGPKYSNLHALFYMHECSKKIGGNIVFENDVIVALIKRLGI